MANSLQTSDARLIFELLRNADENSFTRAQARNEAPFVTFKIAPSYIILESNEDGFNTENITAISAIEKTSKLGSRGYIGEKGIGFKSVFIAAYKVHIQSGLCSFSFNHRPGQSGMGMISPTWEDASDAPADGITRIKLFLHNPIISATNYPVMQQIEDIRETCLLFLRNIRHINIIRIDDRDEATSTTKLSISHVTANRVRLIKERYGSTEESNYHVTKHIASNLPRGENHTYSTAAEAVESWSTSEIVLTFPLDKDSSNPIINNQQVFALLPIQNAGFKVSRVRHIITMST